MNKPNTIPDGIERQATLSTWLRCYPFMASAPKLWGLHKVPISARCENLYPEIVRKLRDDTRPRVFDIVPKSAKVRVAA